MSDSEELINYLSSEDTESDLSSSVETVSNVIFLGAAALLQDTRTAIKRYVEDVVPQYSETEFLQHFRLKRNVFKMLSSRFSQSKFYNVNEGKKRLNTNFLRTPK